MNYGNVVEGQNGKQGVWNTNSQTSNIPQTGCFKTMSNSPSKNKIISQTPPFFKYVNAFTCSTSSTRTQNVKEIVITVMCAIRTLVALKTTNVTDVNEIKNNPFLFKKLYLLN